MKKILLIILFAFFAGNSFAQQVGIDGFIIGSDEGTTVFQGIKNDLQYEEEADNWVRYSKGGPLCEYTLYFKDNILIKVTKIERNYNPNLFESQLSESYLDIAYEYGEPTMSGDSYALWRVGKHKISFRYSVTSNEYESLSEKQLFGAPIMKTIHTLTIQTKIE